MTFVAEDVDPAGLERKSPTEAADIDEITRGMLAIQAQAAADGEAAARARDAREGHLRAGRVRSLRRPPGRRATRRRPNGSRRASLPCPASTRPSCASRTPTAAIGRDRWPDVRAMSFSIDVPPGVVPGATRLDFSMNSASTFPINDSHAFAVAVRVLSAEGMRAKWKALRSLTWSEFRSLLRVMRLGRQQQKGTPRKPYQQLRYWSTVPFLHGGRDAIKYSAIPADNPARPLQAGPNRLQDELVRHVNEDAQMSEFAFALQLLEPGRMTHDGRTEEPSFWVENAAVEWNERESPFHVVAPAAAAAEVGAAAGPGRNLLDRRHRALHAGLAADRQHQPRPLARRIGEPRRPPRATRRRQRVDTGQTADGDSRGPRSASPRSSSLPRWAGRSGPSREICPGPTS